MQQCISTFLFEQERLLFQTTELKRLLQKIMFEDDLRT